MLGELEHLRDRPQSATAVETATEAVNLPAQEYEENDDTIYVTAQGKHIKPRSDNQRKLAEAVRK